MKFNIHNNAIDIFSLPHKIGKDVKTLIAIDFLLGIFTCSSRAENISITGGNKKPTSLI